MSRITRAGPDTVEPDTFDLAAEMEDAYILRDSGYCGCTTDVCLGGKRLAQFSGMDAALAFIRADMDRRQDWPGVFYVNDHGNVTLLDSEGNTHGAWV
jgi:hypothetical protein